jgi:hypothetical protein
MKTFKEFNEAKETDYKVNVKHAIEDINKIIDYGRKIEMDDKALNPLLDAIKSIHTGSDAITKALIPKESKEEPKEPVEKW